MTKDGDKDKTEVAKQKPVAPKPPLPKPHEKFLANTTGGKPPKGPARAKQRIIRHQGR
jgi:hypothetical protein